MAESRRYTFKLRPTAAQVAALEEHARMAADLWNALLEMQETLYRRTRGQRGVCHGEGKSRMTFFDATAEITQLRHACPEWEGLSVWTAHRVARALDEAFKAFFRRAKQGAGASSGYPRYRRRATACWLPHRFASGCRMTAQAPGSRSWRLTLKAVPGQIRARGKLPAEPLKWTDADVRHYGGAWWLSAAVELEPRREAGDGCAEVRLDLIDSFARVQRVDGGRPAGPEREYLSREGRIVLRREGVSDGECRKRTYAPDADGEFLNAARDAVIVATAGSPDADGEGLTIQLSDGLPLVATAVSPDADGETKPFIRSRAGELLKPTSAAEGESSRIITEGERSMRQSEGERQMIFSGNEGENCCVTLQQRLARCKRGSIRYRRLKTRIARIKMHEAARRRDGLHIWTTGLAREFRDMAVLMPESIKEATRSGRGDDKDWGAKAAFKAVLNRHVLDQAPSRAVQMLEYKVAEGGGAIDVRRIAGSDIEAGNAVVQAGKAVRRARRVIRKEKELLSV